MRTLMYKRQSLPGDNFLRSFLIAVISLLYTYALFFSPFSFNFEINSPGSNYILSFTGVLFCLYLIYGTLTSAETYMTIPAMAYILIVYCSATLLFYGSFSNEQLSIVLSLLFIFILFQLFNADFLRFMIFIFVSFTFIEASVLIYQWLSYRSFKNAFLFFNGSLHNSGILACFMVIHFPFLIYMIKRGVNSAITRALLTGGVILFVLFTIYITQSRTALVAFAFIIAVISLREGASYMRGLQLSGYVKLVIIILLIAALIAVFRTPFSGKQLSATGRMFIAEVSSRHLSDHFWFGHGLGSFSLDYPKWQITYFKNTPSPPESYILCAGESYLMFNEFYQLFMETGILGLTIFTVVLYNFFNTRSADYANLLLTLKYTVFCILTCSMTSYPLHVIPIQVIFIFSVGGAYVISNKNAAAGNMLFRNMKLIAFYFILILSVVITFKASEQSVAVYKWLALHDNNAWQRNQLKAKYEDANRVLSKNGKFLIDYGRFLLQDSSDHKQAVLILNKSLLYHFNYSSYQLIAEGYLYAQDIDSAIISYQNLSCYVPSRLLPRYKMIKLLASSGKKAEAKTLARRLLKLPVKVPSNDANMIRSAMKDLVNSR